MSTVSKLEPLLESIVKDNHTFKFPIHSIGKELINMFVSQDDFDYFVRQSYKKLHSEYGSTIGHIFLTTLEMKLDLKNTDMYSLPLHEYQDRIEVLIQSYENLHITKVDRNSPDGEMMSAMQ